MADECRGPDMTGVWENFIIVPDKTGKTDNRGELRVDPHAGTDVTGTQVKGVNTEKFTGKCSSNPGKTAVTLSFNLKVENALIFFGGVIAGKTISGTFYVIAKFGSPPVGATFTPEAGDTGTWGGSQTF